MAAAGLPVAARPGAAGTLIESTSDLIDILSEMSEPDLSFLTSAQRKRYFKKLVKRREELNKEIDRQEPDRHESTARVTPPVVVDGSPRKSELRDITPEDFSPLKKAFKKEHLSRVQAEERLRVQEALDRDRVREIAMLKHPPEIVYPRPGGYHIVRLPRNIEIVTPELFDAAACMAYMLEAAHRIKRARGTTEDPLAVLINMAFVHEASDATAAELDMVFDTYGLYVMPFLPTGRQRAHHNLRSLELLDPARLDASEGASVGQNRCAAGGGRFEDILSIAMPSAVKGPPTQRSHNVYYTEYHDRGVDHLQELGRVLEVV